jgi:hypothetical protein
MKLQLARRLWFGLTCTAALLLAPALAGAAPVSPTLQFRLLIKTNVPLGEILWTGKFFLFDGESRRQLYSSKPDGSDFHLFTTVPANGGEMRCILSPGLYGFPANVIFCHASGGQIYRISMDGKTISQFSAIPTPHGSDGGLTFDSTGLYGHTLLASTGGSDVGPGSVYAVNAQGKAGLVGSYAGPGGAERLGIAPPNFGPVSGQVLITIDQSDHHGRLLAMDPRGKVRTLVTGQPWGLNPIAPLTPSLPAGSGGPAPGLYIVDWASHNVYYAPAGGLRPYAGSLFVGTERHAYMWVLLSQGSRYTLQRLTTNLTAPNYNIEGAVYVS